MTVTYWVTAYECEHEGDLGAYAEAITAAGGKIVMSEINIEAEVAHLAVEADLDFKQRLAKQTCFGEAATDWLHISR